MLESDARIVRPVAFAIALAIALLLQRASPHSCKAGSLRVNGGLWLVNLAVIGTLCGACVCSAADWAGARNIGLLRLAAMPPWATVLASVLALDLVSYGWHRANHVVPFLWRWHRVHHSDRSFTVSTSLRFHPGELLLSLPLRVLAVVALGVPVIGVVVFEVAFTLANAVEHGDISLPAGIEEAASRVVVTPALHRWHHTVDPLERDRNFGTIFSFWDRLFGSYRRNDSRTPIETGLQDLQSVSFTDALRMPLGAAQHR